MAYTKQTWVDNNLSYPVSAARMGTIENGIEAAAIVADQGHRVLTTAQRDALGVVTAGTMIYNSTLNTLQMYVGSRWQNVTMNLSIGWMQATPTYTNGGATSTVFNEDGFSCSVFRFTGTGTLQVTAGGICDVLVVAGGGGGGSLGGGGGAGGLIYRRGYQVNAGTYTVTVGGGGAGGVNQAIGANGGNSVFDTLTAIGGGGGGGYVGGGGTQGQNGGSGGGNAYPQQNLGYGGLPLASNGTFSDTTGQGSFGGPSDSNNPYFGGGGGGAGQNGGSATRHHAGMGGNGLRIDITGQEVWYAGGGGGSKHNDYAGTAGGRGMGGGGDGGGNNGANATANTGGGGGGGGYQGGTFYTGGAGGSGVVIVRTRT